MLESARAYIPYPFLNPTLAFRALSTWKYCGISLEYKKGPTPCRLLSYERDTRISKVTGASSWAAGVGVSPSLLKTCLDALFRQPAPYGLLAAGVGAGPINSRFLAVEKTP